ncbi:MAG: GMC family oxidoreductase [Proteobacteria bacterium]|nr:GMC family oxidoreductase [Pseudomonadota bacterium]MCP4918451.1 GMC family oxidoreductase [Pseudomonadota bacterium]
MSPIQTAPEAWGFDDVPPEGIERECDVCIVGAGPGGSAMAMQLSEAGLSVIVLEEGPPKSDFRLNQAHTARIHMQEAGTMLAQGPTPFLIAAGRGIGGGSLINSALCFRTPDHVLEEWVEVLGDNRWSPSNMAPVFNEVEAWTGVGLPTSAYAAGRHNVAIAEAAARLGYEGGLARRNTPGCVGCGACNYGCPVNGKATVNLNLMARAGQAGTRIQADTKVLDVLIEGGRAVGVSGVTRRDGSDGGAVTVRARHVVLSAGSIGTPRLLHHCGLAERMIDVGEGLLVHPGSAVLASFDEDMDVAQGATQGAWFESPDLPGVLPHAWCSPPEVLTMLLARHFGGFKEVTPHLRRIGGILALVSDHGHGSVSAFSDGRAKIGYSFTDEDITRIQQGMVLCAEVLMEMGATKLFPIAHGVPATSDLAEFSAAMMATSIRDFTLYSSHPMCTMRLGRTLDGRGHAIGVEGLSVADASVFPSSLGVNPQISTMAVATVLGRELASQLTGLRPG